MDEDAKHLSYPGVCKLIKTDSKQSWYVCLGAVVMVGASMGMTNNFGVIFVNLLDEFHQSRRETGKIQSIFSV